MEMELTVDPIRLCKLITHTVQVHTEIAYTIYENDTVTT